MAFEISVDTTMGFSVFGVDVAPSGRFADALPWTFSFSGNQDMDTVFIGVEDFSPGEFPGVQPGDLELAFIITLDLRDCYNQLWQNYWAFEINVIPLNSEPENWFWNYTIPSTDGDKNINFIMYPCGLIDFVSKPENDIITAPHCEGVQFQFVSMNFCGFPDTLVQNYEMRFETYGAEINNDGLFTFYPDDPGTYTLTVDGKDIMGIHGCYEFDVVLTNEGFTFDKIPTGSLKRIPGTELVYDFGLTSLDCDPAVTETINILGSPGEGPANQPSVENGVFTWQTEMADLGVWQFELVCEDQYGAWESCQFLVDLSGDFTCGDVNFDDKVNVSDAVYIINYVFSGGNEPNPPESGDVNCDSRVNVSDAVWIINYVFASGADPCDC